MELIAIALARVASFLEVQALDPIGKASTMDVLQSIGSRYSFAKIPQTLADIDLQNGIELLAGNCNGVKIDKLTVYWDGMAIDTRSSTDDCEKVLQDLLALAKELFGAAITIRRKIFSSQLVFRTEVRLAVLNPLLQDIIDRLQARVSDDLKHPYVFDAALNLVPDLSQAKIAPLAFTIEHRAGIPFSEDTYFSSAPLRTREHIELLNAFETALRT